MERDVFGAAVARHARRVHTFASYLLGDASEAEDITQEVLIRLWTRGSDVAPERMGAWLLTVTRNACTDALRRRRRSAEIIPIRRRSDAPPEPPSSDPGPERLAAGVELGSRILAALNALPEPSRSIVILREIQGLSYREIGEVMEMSVSTLKVTLYRARRKLRESLEEVRSHVATG